MIIFCDSGGNVNSVPSTIPFGSALTDITIVAFEMAATTVLKIKPPNQQYSPGIVCAPVIQDGVVVYQAKLNKAVTNTFGRCEYQIEFYLQDGDEVPIVSTYSGSFNVSRGVPVDLPASEELLKDMALENIYAALSSVTRLAEEITALLEFTGAETELQTAAKNLGMAVNELYARPVVYVDSTLTKSGNAADAKVTGDLLAEKVNTIDIINNLTSNLANKPLSAAQGVVLKSLVTNLQTALDALKNSVVTADKITKAIGEHNQNENAHPALIAAIQAVADTVNGLNVDSKIADAIYSHTTSPEAHQDIRILLQELSNQVNHFLDVDDTTRDQLSELLALIDENIEDIENLVAGYVKYTDIIDNLETNLANKVLSAAQGVELKRLIEEVRGQIATAIYAHNQDATAHQGLREDLEGVGDRVTALENAKPDMSGYVTTEQFETALGAYITDIDNIVGGGIEGATLITFTIEGTEYQAEEGMTWNAWCKSAYNTGGYTNADGAEAVYYDNKNYAVEIRNNDESVLVEGQEVIISGQAYYHWKSTTLISFTIAGTTYQAEDGMTWEQWCASEYNTGGYSVDSGGNIFSNGNRVDDDSTALAVTKTDTIVSGGTYRHTSAGGAG